MWWLRFRDSGSTGIVSKQQLDTIIYESFAKKPHDSNVAPSVEDKLVLKSYKNSVKNVGGRFEIGLPFKNENVELPNNYQYALDRMVKLDNRFLKNPELKNNYFKFMGKLFEDGHAIELDNKKLNDRPGKIWYQSHFCVSTSNKFRVVFDCAARFRGVNLNDFMYKGPGMRNNLV